MSPSSLIFITVVAIWATYIVVDRTRRREHLATARSVDRFSAHMRVLQRRAVRRESAQTFEASSAIVKRSSSPLLYRTPVSTQSAAATASATSAVTAAAKSAQSASECVAAAVAHTTRRRRLFAAAGTLVAAVAAVLTGVWAAFGMLPVAVPVAATLLSVGLVAWLRSQAVADRARVRRAQASARRAVERERRATEEAAQAAEAARPVAAPVGPQRRAAPAAEILDLRQWNEHEVVASALENDPLQGVPGWQPVPVPPPTYTLKARAARSIPPPLSLPDDTLVALQDDWDDVAWDEPWSRAVVG